jgi:release factor glutamine methyltransferase
VSFVNTDLLHAVEPELHVVLANLPYVPSGRELPRDVQEYEPNVAIFAGQRGTELIERLLEQARPLLAPSAEVAVELDEEEQAAPIAQLARRLYADAAVCVCQDAGGYDRVVRILLP